MRATIVLLVAALISAGSEHAEAQHASLSERIDTYLDPLVADRVFSGVVLIGSPDSIWVFRAYGSANYVSGRAFDLNTRFRIASVTKTMTAAAIRMLADRGTLSLTDTLSRFVPDFDAAKRITIRHLLRHESGVANPDYLESFHTRVDLPGLVDRVAAKPLVFEPGSRGQYSNAGYNLLAYVIEQASGVPYDDFLAREIFAPVGMTSTALVRDLKEDSQHATGYVPGPTSTGVVEPSGGDIGFSIGSGHLSSSALDLYRWGVALHRNQLFDLDLEIASDWPYGWGKGEVGGVPNVNQTGATQGFMSSLAVFDDGTILVMLLNLENGRWWRIANDLAAIVFDAPYEVPARLSRRDMTDDLSLYAGRYAREGAIIEIRVEAGHLWLYGGGWPVGKWLVPIAPGGFAVPSDAGQIRFSDLRADGYGVLEWDFGDGASTYRRIEAGGQ